MKSLVSHEMTILNLTSNSLSLSFSELYSEKANSTLKVSIEHHGNIEVR
jgi:hypothetical protein